MTQPSSKATVWAGYVISAIPVVGLFLSAAAKFSGVAPVMGGFTRRFGYPAAVITPIGVVEVACTLLYIIPQTSVLGAILVVGYLGGAIATHVRVEDYAGIAPPLALGVFAWLGLYLRDPRLRGLIPLRKG